MTLTAKRAEQSLRGHGRVSQRDEGVAQGVRTRMAWGPQLRAAVARGGPLLPTLPDTEDGPSTRRPAHALWDLGSLLGPWALHLKRQVGPTEAEWPKPH